MKRNKSIRLLILIFNLLSFTIFISCNSESQKSGNRIFTDATGNKITVKTQVEKVISLAPNITEIIAAVKGGAKLRGKTKYCNFPDWVNKIQVVGDLQYLDYEKILAIAPDVVCMSFAGNSPQNYDKLKSLGINIFAVSADSINSILNSIKTISDIIGTKAEGDTLYAELKNELNFFQEKLIQKNNRNIKIDKKKIFVVISPKPLITVAHGFLDEIITVAGGLNIAKNKLEDYPQFSREELILSNPDVIIYPTNMSQEAAYKELANMYPELKQINAFKKNKIFVIDPDIAFRPSPRFVENIKQIANCLE